MDTSDGVITLTWTDPEDEYYYPDLYEDKYPLAIWKGTKVVRKEGSKPENVNDGVLVVDSTERNQYSEEGFTDEVEKGIAYWYAFYPYTEKGAGEPEFVEGAKFYDMTWYNADGTVLTVSKAQESTIPVYPDGTPEDPSGKGTFTGFLPAQTEVTGPASYYACYSYSNMEETISDPWPVIHENTVNKLHSQYPIKGTKITLWGSYGPVLMELVARDTDTMTAGGRAGLTWIAKDCISGKYKWDQYTRSVYNGWKDSTLKTTLEGTIWDALPAFPKDYIVKVNKTYSQAQNNSKTATDSFSIWLPSVREMAGYREDSGVTYQSVFNNDSARIKNAFGTKTPTHWWTRSVNDAQSMYAYVIQTTGTPGTLINTDSYPIAPGFCTN